MPAPLEPAVFADPRRILHGAFAMLEPPERLGVPEAAEKYMVLNNPGGGYSGSWSFDLVPYARRPMECLNPDNGYSLVAVMGPSQCAKSSIGNAWMLQGAVCDPADVIFLGPDKDIIRSYSNTEISKLIHSSPKLKALLLDTASADNIFMKQFRGCTWHLVWPVASQLRARPVPRARIDDYDAVPEDIDGEGNALVLLGGRQTTFEGFEKTYVNSTPALGPKKGIEALVASGTDERWWVRCRHKGRTSSCDFPFRLAFDEVLVFDRDGTPEEAQKSAAVVCPDCGGVHEQHHKVELQARGAWVGPEQALRPDGTVEGELRQTSTASFRFDGLMGFRSWGNLAKEWRQAELSFERSQDEHDLRAFYNTRVGVNYRRRTTGERPLELLELEERAQLGLPRGLVPDWAKILTAAVDVQANRFEAMVQAWGEGFESAVIDRFPILALEDGTTAIEPHRRPEHWRVLINHVIWRRYPRADDPELTLPVFCTAIDTGGIDQVTDNAFNFWHTANRLGVPATAITLIKGGSNPRAKLLPPPTIDAKRQVKGARQVELYVPNVNRLKDTLDIRLRRREAGAGYIHLYDGLTAAQLGEMIAEEKDAEGRWTRDSHAANESWDLLVYNYVNLLRFGGTDSSLGWVDRLAPWALAARTGGGGQAAAGAAAPAPNAPAAGSSVGAPTAPKPTRPPIRFRRQ